MPKLLRPHVLCRFLIGGVFLWGALFKTFGNADGAVTIYEDLVGGSRTGSITIIATELALALWLGAGIWIRAAAMTSILLLSTFSAVIVVETNKDDPRACGCLSASAADPTAIRKELYLSLVGNGLLTVGAMWLFLRRDELAPVIRTRSWCKCPTCTNDLIARERVHHEPETSDSGIDSNHRMLDDVICHAIT